MIASRVLGPLQPSQEQNVIPSNEHRSSVTEGMVKPLQALLTCPGCKKQFNDFEHRPKFLLCFHTACLFCVSNSFQDGKITCPTCNHESKCGGPSSLKDNLQLCTILMNLSSLNLNDPSPAPREACSTHAARINFWCETCRLPICRDCTILAHRQSAGHKVKDHSEASILLKNEISRAIADIKTLQKETQALRQDHRKYLVRQLDACKIFEKQLKLDIKSLDTDKKEDGKNLDKLEIECKQNSSILSLQKTAEKANEYRIISAQEFAAAKDIVTEKMLTLGKLNRSLDNLDDVVDLKSASSGSSPPSPSRLLDNGSAKGLRKRLKYGLKNKSFRPTVSIDSTSQFGNYSTPFPKVFLDFRIENITQTCRIVCELRPDKAPKLCENFIRLCTGKSGYGYKGSKIFRCLPGWWIQGGDFEHNNGEGGKSAMEANFIMTEKTDLKPRPGAVEMLCVSSNEKGKLMVGSQFFIHLKNYSYTNVFGYVLGGLDLIERLSKMGNPVEVYHPTQAITIVDCGLVKP